MRAAPAASRFGAHRPASPWTGESGAGGSSELETITGPLSG